VRRASPSGREKDVSAARCTRRGRPFGEPCAGGAREAHAGPRDVAVERDRGAGGDAQPPSGRVPARRVADEHRQAGRVRLRGPPLHDQ
jgi:hypothetical protein